MKAVLLGWWLALVSAARAWWREFQLARDIRVLELEVKFHAPQLAFYAERNARLKVALLHARERMRLHRLRAHQPSLLLLNGGRR